MSNFIKRTLSGIFFVSIIIGSILLSPYVFALTFSIITCWTIYEFHKLTNHQMQIEVMPVLSIVGAGILFITSFLYAAGQFQYPIFSLYGVYVVLVLIVELYRKKENPIHNWAYFLLGQVIIALPFSLLNFILFIESYHPFLLIAVFAIIWLNDTGAYLTGITIGKRRLFERISPKKSWEGFFGGNVIALLSGYVCSLLIPEISLLAWLFFAQIIVVFGTFGDLLESLMKRTVHVKDSGDIIPGHGGLLDRFDSMLLVAPAIFIYLSFLFR